MEGRIKNNKVEKPPIPKIGNIRVGIKVEKNGKTYPQSTDYFVATSQKESYVKAFHEYYNEKPKSIQLIFFSDNLSESCWEEYEYRDTAGKCFAKGDGENYKVFSKKDKMYKEFTLTERKNLISEIEKASPGGKWSHILKLKFFIIGLDVFGFWEFDTRAELTSIPNIRDTFDFVHRKVGHIAGIEFDLNVIMAKSDKPGDARRYPIVTLVPKIPESKNIITFDQNILQIEDRNEKL